MLRYRYCALFVLLFSSNCVYSQVNDGIDTAAFDKKLTAAERTFGLVQFWTEVKYNFAYFDQVPELDWDASLKEYIPLVQNAENDVVYYRLMEQFCALLKNVNTKIFPPKRLVEKWDRPQLRIELIENAPVVVNRSKQVGNKVPLGARITSVNQVPLETHLEQNVFPYITAGGTQVERRWAAHDLMKGAAGSKVSFTFLSLDGKEGSATLVRSQKAKGIEWELPSPERFLINFEILENQVGLLTINSFADQKIVEAFLEYLPEIKNCEKLVIDLRTNMSGNAVIAYDILKHFTDKPLLTTSWRTREHRSTNWALGKSLAEVDATTLNEQDRYNQQMYLGEVWHVVPADTIQSALAPIPTMPIAVLMSNYTAAGAEKFLVSADVLENFTFIGESSFGDSAQLPMLSLPGGGSARISTKRDTYPDGKVYIGPGISVDVRVASSTKDYLEDRDVVLAKALEVLK